MSHTEVVFCKPVIKVKIVKYHCAMFRRYFLEIKFADM